MSKGKRGKRNSPSRGKRRNKNWNALRSVSLMHSAIWFGLANQTIGACYSKWRARRKVMLGLSELSLQRTVTFRSKPSSFKLPKHLSSHKLYQKPSGFGYPIQSNSNKAIQLENRLKDSSPYSREFPNSREFPTLQQPHETKTSSDFPSVRIIDIFYEVRELLEPQIDGTILFDGDIRCSTLRRLVDNLVLLGQAININSQVRYTLRDQAHTNACGLSRNSFLASLDLVHNVLLWCLCSIAWASGFTQIPLENWLDPQEELLIPDEVENPFSNAISFNEDWRCLLEHSVDWLDKDWIPRCLNGEGVNSLEHRKNFLVALATFGALP